jgi:hypothetical protein
MKYGSILSMSYSCLSFHIILNYKNMYTGPYNLSIFFILEMCKIIINDPIYLQ